MINKYGDFIKEQKRYTVKLLLEACLFATSEFMEKLRYMSKEKGPVGDISREIYDFIEQEQYVDNDNIKQNFFNVTDKEDMVSFLMQNKIPKGWDDEADPSLPYNAKGRGEIKISKVIKYILNLMDESGELHIDMPKDKDIEAFVNLYKSSSSSSKFKFKLLKGDDIAKYYNQKKYLTESGSLGSSCMADESKGTFKIYSQNEDKVKLLVYIDEESDKISGRALVWKLKDSPCDAKYFMDRVYTNRDSDFFKFRAYANDNDYLYKEKMNSHLEDNVCFKYKGSDVYGEITVKLDGSARNYPFIDTLCFMNKEKTLLSNVPGEDYFFLHSVSGECETCDNCNGKGWICDDAQCQYNDGEVDCDNCNGTGDSNDSKCVNCKGKGFIKCDHVEKEICSDCSQGHIELQKRKILTNFVKKFQEKK